MPDPKDELEKDPERLLTGVDYQDETREWTVVPEVPGNVSAQVDQLVIAIKEELQRPQGDHQPLKVPDFPSTPIMMLFFASLNADEWMRENAIVVCFDHDGGRRIMGVGLKCDLAFWKSPLARLNLRSKIVTCYDVEEYVKLALAENIKDSGSGNDN